MEYNQLFSSQMHILLLLLSVQKCRVLMSSAAECSLGSLGQHVWPFVCILMVKVRGTRPLLNDVLWRAILLSHDSLCTCCSSLVPLQTLALTALPAQRTDCLPLGSRLLRQSTCVTLRPSLPPSYPSFSRLLSPHMPHFCFCHSHSPLSFSLSFSHRSVFL